MRVGERVIVDAAATGDGMHHHGVVEDVYVFARATFIAVSFDEPTPWGTWSTVVTNPGLLRKEVTA